MNEYRSGPQRARPVPHPRSQAAPDELFLPEDGHLAGRLLVVGADHQSILEADRSVAGAAPRIHIATDVATVAETVARGDIDLALVAVDLPGRATSDVIELLRTSTRATVLATGAPTQAELLLAAVEAGAHDFLVTPLRREELRLRVGAARSRTTEPAGPGFSAPPRIAGSPFDLIHDLNNVLGAMRTTMFLSLPTPASVTDEPRSARLDPEEVAARMDRLVTRSSELLAELNRRLMSLS